MHDFQAQYVIRTTAEQVTQPITSPHYSLLILEGLNKRKKSKVYLRLFQDVQYFCHNKKVEIKGKFLNNLLLLFLVAISIRSPLPTLRVHPTRSISLPVSQGCSPKKKNAVSIKGKGILCVQGIAPHRSSCRLSVIGDTNLCNFTLFRGKHQ